MTGKKEHINFKLDCKFDKFPALLKKRLWHSCFPVNFAKFLHLNLNRLLNCMVKESEDLRKGKASEENCPNHKDISVQIIDHCNANDQENRMDF